MLCVDYIDNFETKALDAIRDLSGEAGRADNARTDLLECIQPA
jgi:hypothetical protein